MKLLLAAPPVFTPTTMPYSLAMLKSEVASRLKDEVKALDLNALFHFNEFKEYYDRKETEDFFPLLTEFFKEIRSFYPQISQDVLNNKHPQGYDRILKSILDEKPDVVGLSLTYNSQIFFAKLLIEDLKKNNVEVILGGPADYSKISDDCLILGNAEELVAHLLKKGFTTKESKESVYADFSDFDKKHYFTKDLVYSLKTSKSCPYKRCTFCTHHGRAPYELFDLSIIRQSIIKNNMKKVCIIDDDLPHQRLNELADLFEELKIKWWCQLRPLKPLIPLLPKLKQSGLVSVAWGLESGSQKTLDQMQKGTKIEEIKEVLKESHKVGIKNMTYVLFGLPGETEEDFKETINFLKENKENIDLISTSVFGLQYGSKIMEEPEKYKIENITFEGRTLLSDKIFYEVKEGLSHKEATKLKNKYLKEIEEINSVPRVIAACKEQILNY